MYFLAIATASDFEIIEFAFAVVPGNRERSTTVDGTPVEGSGQSLDGSQHPTIMSDRIVKQDCACFMSHLSSPAWVYVERWHPLTSD